METYAIRHKTAAGNILKMYEAESPESAARRYVDEYVPGYDDTPFAPYAYRVSGEPRLSGCFRAYQYDPRISGSNSVGDQFHVQEMS